MAKPYTNVLHVNEGWDAAKTAAVHQRMKNLRDDEKLRFAINWRMPHTLLNVAATMFRGDNLDGVDWYAIFQTHDLGTWSHGGVVVVGSFSNDANRTRRG